MALSRAAFTLRQQIRVLEMENRLAPINFWSFIPVFEDQRYIEAYNPPTGKERGERDGECEMSHASEIGTALVAVA